MMARPDKLTPEVQERIVVAIRAGNTREAAASYAGICDRTLYKWLAKGQNGTRCDSKFVQFLQAIKEAENECELTSVAIIRAAANKQWQAAAWWLERRRSDQWGRKESLDVTIRREAERMAKETGLSAEEIITQAERIVRGK